MTGAGESEATRLIADLALAPHPEGGWYRETWRADAADGARPSGTAILFLLEEGQRSHWHRVDATEIWLWHAGSPLRLSVAGGDGGEDDAGEEVREVRLGGDLLAGEIPQYVIAPHRWQAAAADRGWALVSCVVSPGFRFEGFELAPPGWSPDGA
ncbi:MAG: cupin domain-containing protein [Sphingomonas sp.]|nr:cupin domain-containing protein [Sphingomonas sp.]MDX3883080.1 cupin domain-containing protein [Sphingomonas sp.]